MPSTLTHAARELLHVLQFRDDLGPMYVVPAARGRYGIVVTEMTTSRHLARVDAVARPTVWELESASLIDRTGDDVAIHYAGRRHLDGSSGRLLVLLAAGRATCPTCGAVGREECSTTGGKPMGARRHPKRPAVPAGAAPAGPLSGDPFATEPAPPTKKRTTWTQAELRAEAIARFGKDPRRWAFVCPSCGDVATPQDFVDAGADPNGAGSICIGRVTGALVRAGATNTRGCDWSANGLFRGPWLVTLPAEEGKPEREVGAFRLADAPVPS